MRLPRSLPARPRPARALVRAAALVAVGLPALPAAGQDAELLRRLERQLQEFDATYRLEVAPDQPIAEKLVLEYGSSLRFGYYTIPDSEGVNRSLYQFDGVLYVRADLNGTHRFFGRLRFLYNEFDEGESLDGRGSGLAAPIGDRYWYEFSLRGAQIAETGSPGPYDLRLRAGRQYVDWRSGLSLSQALYAGIADFEYGALGLVGIVGLTPSTGTIDFDGSRPGFDSDTDRGFFGGAIEYRGLARHRPYFSALVQRDYNERDFAVFEIGGLSYPTSYDYDSEYWSIGSNGAIGPQMTYRTELIYQTGRGLSSSFDAVSGLPTAQTKEDISAWAGKIGVTWLARDAADSRVDLEFVAGSGDDDRLSSSDTFGGNRTGTTDTAFNSLGYANSGLALAPEITNLLSLRVGFSTAPGAAEHRGEWLRLGVNGFLFGKTEPDAPISVNTDRGERFVGGEIDLFLDWRVASDVELSLRYGVFLPGSAMPDGEDDARHFLYAGVTYGF